LGRERSREGKGEKGIGGEGKEKKRTEIERKG